MYLSANDEKKTRSQINPKSPLCKSKISQKFRATSRAKFSKINEPKLKVEMILPIFTDRMDEFIYTCQANSTTGAAQQPATAHDGIAALDLQSLSAPSCTVDINNLCPGFHSIKQFMFDTPCTAIITYLFAICYHAPFTSHAHLVTCPGRRSVAHIP